MGKLAMLALVLASGCLSRPGSGAPSASIGYVGPFLGTSFPTVPATGLLHAQARGDAIVMHLAIGSFGQSTTFSVSAPNWNFQQIGSTTGAATFVAIAPDANPVTFTFDSTYPATLVVLADEFTDTDPTGGSATFVRHTEAAGSTGHCLATLSVAEPGDVIWAACTTQGVATPGAGFSLGIQSNGNAAEFRTVDDPPNTAEPVEFTSDPVWALTAVTMKPR